MDEDDSYFLYVGVLFSRPESILEIGHYLGKSTAAICQAIRDAGLVTRFDSFDLPYKSPDEFEEYYSKIHNKKIEASLAYSEYLGSGKVFTDSATKNLKQIGLDTYVNLFAKDFRDSGYQSYDLIFADVLHDSEEINHNLSDILKFGHSRTIYMFDDMKHGNIELIESISNLRAIRKTGKIAAFLPR